MPSAPAPEAAARAAAEAEIATADEVEELVRQLAEGLIVARPGECLYCYLTRMLEAFGCDNTLRWSERWREQQQTAYRWLMTWLRKNGGYCDCEVLFNVFRDHRRSQRHLQLRCAV